MDCSLLQTARGNLHWRCSWGRSLILGWGLSGVALAIWTRQLIVEIYLIQIDYLVSVKSQGIIEGYNAFYHFSIWHASTWVLRSGEELSDWIKSRQAELNSTTIQHTLQALLTIPQLNRKFYGSCSFQVASAEILNKLPE